MNNETRLTGYFGGGLWNKETKSFDIKKNVSKNGNLSLGLQYKITSKDIDGNKIYNGIKVKMLIGDKSELETIEKLMEGKCTVTGFYTAVEFEGNDGKIKYVEFVCKSSDFTKADDEAPFEADKPKTKAKEEPEVERW